MIQDYRFLTVKAVNDMTDLIPAEIICSIRKKTLQLLTFISAFIKETYMYKIVTTKQCNPPNRKRFEEKLNNQNDHATMHGQVRDDRHKRSKL